MSLHSQPNCNLSGYEIYRECDHLQSLALLRFMVHATSLRYGFRYSRRAQPDEGSGMNDEILDAPRIFVYQHCVFILLAASTYFENGYFWTLLLNVKRGFFFIFSVSNRLLHCNYHVTVMANIVWLSRTLHSKDMHSLCKVKVQLSLQWYQESIECHSCIKTKISTNTAECNCLIYR